MDKKVDPISRLPPFIIHHIMTYLSPEEVAQLSILSKRWNQLRISFPVFDFDQTYFEGKGFALCKFLNFVDTSLVQFCKFDLSMLKFRLFIRLSHCKESAPYFDKWIELATEKEVKEFDLKFLNDSAIVYGMPNVIYTLPQTIFSARSMTTLRLVGCKLENVLDTIRLNSLRTLSLEKVCMNSMMVQKICSECPVLEELFLSHCWGLKGVCVSKALKLKKVTFKSDEFESVEIVVPDLQELTLEFSQCVSLRVIDIIGGSQLKKLKFTGTDLKEQDFHHFISKFPLLEDLTFINCYFLERIMILSTQLKKFRVTSFSYMKALDLDTPSLLSFTYEDSPIPTSRINALCHCPWQAKFLSYFTFDTQWCLKLREFLGLSNRIEALSMYVRETVSSFKLEEFRKSFPSLPCNVENLELYTNVPTSEYRILLDGLLWICCPRTLSLQTFEAQHKLFESFYNELKNRDVSCCNSHDIKCWRHYLKDIKVESFEYHKDRKLVGADNLTKLMSTDNLSDPWSILPSGMLRLQLDWCFPVSIENS